MVYTDKQRLELEKEFQSNRYITTLRKAELSMALGLSERQVRRLQSKTISGARLTQQTCKTGVQGTSKVNYRSMTISLGFLPHKHSTLVSLFAPFVCNISSCRVFMLNFFMVVVKCLKVFALFSQEQLGFVVCEHCG